PARPPAPRPPVWDRRRRARTGYRRRDPPDRAAALRQVYGFRCSWRGRHHKRRPRHASEQFAAGGSAPETAPITVILRAPWPEDLLSTRRILGAETRY